MTAQQALLALTAVLLQATAALAAGKCSSIPFVSGVDQAATLPQNYGKCTSATERAYTAHSSWCSGKLGKSFKAWPGPPTGKAAQCLKFGRATIYRGPMYGSSKAHKAACNKILHGSSKAALVAVSTKYLKTYQGGWTPGNTGACGKCMCIRMNGADQGWNPGVQKDTAKKHMGLTFLGKVGDRCAECPDDSIDILQDRPFSYAPYKPSVPHDNPFAPYANSKPGIRGFSDISMLRGASTSPEAVGTWTADWQWVPCSYTHEQCGDLMKSMGYSNVWTPKMTPGIDSVAMRELGNLRVKSSFGCPHNDRSYCDEDRD